MLETGVCARCTSTYDGGEYWSREQKKCVPECNVLNMTQKVCERQTDKVHCPFYVSLGDNKFECYSVCPEKSPYRLPGGRECLAKCETPSPLVEGEFCVASCSGGNKYYSLNAETQIYQC